MFVAAYLSEGESFDLKPAPHFSRSDSCCLPLALANQAEWVIGKCWGQAYVYAQHSPIV